MANEEHLAILRQGVEVWNQWRQVNYDIKPDISQSDISQINLSGVDFRKANLSQVDLRRVNLGKADLRMANLHKANLSGAKLSKANLSGANLSEVILSEVDLSGRDFSGRDFSGVDLSGAVLSGVDLSGANLHKANLSGARLNNVSLQRAKLNGVNLSQVDLSGRDFNGVNLSGANLQNANLQTARLINANLDGANLTEAHLWETQRAGWSIKGVICDYIYWDKDAKEKTYYQPGDFERLFSEQNKIKLFYKDGANLLEIATLPSIIKNLEEKHPGCKLSFQSIEEASGGAIATLVLEESKDIAVEEVEAVRAVIQAEAEHNIEVFRQALNSKDRDIAKLEGEVEALDRTINNMMSRLQPVIYNISGQVGAAGQNAHTQDSTFNQIVNAENSSVDTQIQGERNIAVDGDVNGSDVSTGDKSSIENE